MHAVRKRVKEAARPRSSTIRLDSTTSARAVSASGRSRAHTTETRASTSALAATPLAIVLCIGSSAWLGSVAV